MSGCVWGCKKIYWANITFGHDTQILRFLPVPSLVRKNDNNWKCLVGVGVSGWCMDGIWGWLGPSGLCPVYIDSKSIEKSQLDLILMRYCSFFQWSIISA